MRSREKVSLSEFQVEGVKVVAGLIKIQGSRIEPRYTSLQQFFEGEVAQCERYRYYKRAQLPNV